MQAEAHTDLAAPAGETVLDLSDDAEPAAPSVAADRGFGPTLDTDVEPWVAHLPGLGTVSVDAAGELSITVEDGLPLPAQSASVAAGADDDQDAGAKTPKVDSVEQKEQALRYGWGEPLSWARRGYRLAGGATAVDPANGRCLLITGDAHDCAAVLLALAAKGWRVLADRVTPVEWQDGALLAHPREAPILASKRRLRKAELTGERVRGDSDARIAPVERASEPAVITGVLSLVGRRPDEEVFELLTGHERFEAATNLITGGVLAYARRQATTEAADSETADTEDPAVAAERTAAVQEALAEHLKLAALPMARLHFDSATLQDDINGVLNWVPGSALP